MDDPVDRLNRATHLEALKLADDPAALDWGMHMNVAARALERVGDNAVDIGEQVGFLVTGEFQEFTDASHRRREGGWVAEPGRGSSSSRTRSRSPTRCATPSSARASRSSVAADGRRAIERFRADAPDLVDPRPDAARDLGARRLPDDPPGVRRTDHHGHGQGLRGRQGDRARARAPTTTSRSRSRCASSSRGSARTCAERAMHVGAPRRRGPRGGPVRDGRRAARGHVNGRVDVLPAEGVRAARGVPAPARAASSPASS